MLIYAAANQGRSSNSFKTSNNLCSKLRCITYHDMMKGTAPSAAFNTTGVAKAAKYSDFEPIEGYISEAVQHRK